MARQTNTTYFRTLDLDVTILGMEAITLASTFRHRPRRCRSSANDETISSTSIDPTPCHSSIRYVDGRHQVKPLSKLVHNRRFNVTPCPEIYACLASCRFRSHSVHYLYTSSSASCECGGTQDPTAEKGCNNAFRIIM